MHEHLCAGRTSHGEEAGLVRLGTAEDLNGAGLSSLDAGAHFRWHRREPDGVDTNR